MITEKSVMKTECTFDDKKEHRYILKKEWDSKKSKAMLIMSNAGTADTLDTDMTSMYAIRNLVKLGEFGAVDIVNILSNITSKIDTKEDLQTTSENMEQILKSAERADKIIVACGKRGDTSQKFRKVQDAVLERLRPFADKMYIIGSAKGAGFHVLAPQIRHEWILQKYRYKQEQEEVSVKENTEE